LFEPSQMVDQGFVYHSIGRPVGTGEESTITA